MARTKVELSIPIHSNEGVMSFFGPGGCRGIYKAPTATEEAGARGNWMRPCCWRITRDIPATGALLRLGLQTARGAQFPLPRCVRSGPGSSRRYRRKIIETRLVALIIKYK